MSTYKEIFGKAIKSIAGDPNPSPVTYTVTVANPGSGNKYYIDGVLTPTLELYEGNTYNFDYSGASSHPFRFSATSDGTHNSGTEYTSGVSVDSNITTIVVQVGAPTLYYYCSSHSGMGGTALTPAADSTLEGQIWYNESLGKFRSVLATGAWSSAPSIATGRYLLASAGATYNATIIFGGVTNPGSSYRTQTESYNGTTWSEVNDMGTGRFLPAKNVGTATAALAAGGYTGSTVSNVEEFNGTSWSAETALPAANRNQAGFGTQTAGVVAGGNLPPITTTAIKYDGSSWTSANALPVAKEQMSGSGTETAGLVIGGRPPSGNVATVEEFDGTNFSSGGALLVAQAGNIGAGTQTDTYQYTAYGASPLTSTSNYDGTSWTANVNMATAISSGGGSTGQGAGFSQIQGGGSTPSTSSSTTSQEFNFSIYSPVAATWSSGGSLNTARENGAVSGSKTAGLYAGGKVYPNSFQNASEEYNGTSWAEGNNLGTARSNIGGAGTQTAGLAAGGTNGAPGSSGVQTATEEYGGTSWTAGGALSTARMNTSTAGLQTAAFMAGGINSSNNLVTTVEHYNGSSWTSGTAMPGERSNSAAAGTQTAGLAFGGYVPPSYAFANTTIEYDGEGWTAGGNLSVARYGLGGFGSQTNAVAFAGTTPPNSNSNSTELYNGTSWSTAPNLATSRTGFSPSGSYNSGTDGFAAGGSQAGNPMNAQTEEWSPEVIALDYKNISSS